jgi:anti-sigma regulatory factor (Ser/Thr protein kinase)
VRTLDIDDTAPREARRWIARSLVGAPDDIRERVLLVVSELVTNVLRHGGDRATVRVAVTGPVMRLEVTDRERGAVVRRDVQPSSVSGRGLLIVECLTDRWGVAEASERGTKTVWCELDLYSSATSGSSAARH